MALPKPMRALAVASVLISVYLLFQLFRSPRSLLGPGEKLLEMTEDPNLKRESSLESLFTQGLQNSSNGGALGSLMAERRICSG